MEDITRKFHIPYVLIPKSALDFSTPSFFDIYVPVGDRYVKVINSGQPIDVPRVEKYLEKNADVLYIESQTIERFLDNKFSAIFDSLSTQPDTETRLREVVRCLELCILDLRLVRFHPDKFMRIRMVIDTLYSTFKNREVRAALLRVTRNDNGNALTRRSILGAFIGIALVFEQGDVAESKFSSLMLGAICRDLDCIIVDGLDPHDHPEVLQGEHGKNYREHPSRIVKRLNELEVLDDVSESIIYQHHESPNGTGFPRGIKRLETYMPAQFLWLGDWLVTVFAQAEKQNLPVQLLVEHIRNNIPPEQNRVLPLILRVVGQCIAVTNLSLAK